MIIQLDVVFECKVPKAILSTSQQGFQYATRRLTEVTREARSVGSTTALDEGAVKYAKERKQFTQNRTDFRAYMIAESS